MPDQPPPADLMPTIPANLIPVKEVAARMNVSPMTVYRMIHSEELRAYRIGRSFRVDPKDVTAFVRSGNTIAWETRAGGAA